MEDKNKVAKVEKEYDWAPDEWYYEGEIEDYRYWKAEEDREAYEQRLRNVAEEHERELASRPFLSLFEDQIDDVALYNKEDDLEALDYEDAHLGFNPKKSPKFNF
nr:hypothetical protein [Tanacetum cinerariifolium]